MQLTIGLVSAGLDPQIAVDMTRFFITDGTHNGISSIKEDVHNDVIDELEAMGPGACDKTPS